jgi:hypothetical protein
MYWMQKGQITCTTAQRRNQLSTQIANYLAGKDTRSTRVENATDGTNSLFIRVQYNSKTDSDLVWDDVMTADGSGWVTTPSFMGYGQFPETPEEGEYILLGRRDW